MSGASVSSGQGQSVGRYLLFDEIAAGGMATIHIGRLHRRGRLLADRSRSSGSCPSSRATPSSSRCSSTRRASLRASVTRTSCRCSTSCPRARSSSSSWSSSRARRSTRLTRVSRKRARIVPMPIALAIVADMLQGLHAAHEAKDERGEPLDIVHRDISPHNVMVGDDGVSRVLDFGIAKASSSSQSTRDGEVKGKFAYMSPEQLSSAPVDRRADVFAASIVLWEMLTGSRLFQAPDPAGIVGKVLNGRIAPPSQLAGGIPPQLDALVLQGPLARRPHAVFDRERDGASHRDARHRHRAADRGRRVGRIASRATRSRSARAASPRSRALDRSPPRARSPLPRPARSTRSRTPDRTRRRRTRAPGFVPGASRACHPR